MFNKLGPADSDRPRSNV